MQCCRNKGISLKESHLNFVSACDCCGANGDFICSYFKHTKLFVKILCDLKIIQLQKKCKIKGS